MVNIFAPTPKINPSAAVNIGHSVFKNGTNYYTANIKSKLSIYNIKYIQNIGIFFNECDKFFFISIAYYFLIATV